MALECIKNIIGLSQSDCACLGVESKPVDWNTSLSGLFIDDIEMGVPLIMPTSSLDCGETSIWTLLEKARDEALNEFLTNYLIMLPKYQARKQNDYKFEFGSLKKVNKVLGLTKQYAGVYIKSIKQHRGSVLRVNNICLYVDSASAIDVEIYQVNDDYLELMHTETVNTTSNRNTCQAVSYSGNAYIDLPLVNNYGESIEYFIMYDRTGIQPWNVQYHCGCSSTKPQWMQEVYAGAIEVDDITTSRDASLNRSYTYGLKLDTELRCDPTSFMCNDLDFGSDGWSRAMAKTIQLFAQRKLVQYLIDSPRLNRFTILNTDSLFKKRSDINGEIEYRMEYLSARYPYTKSDCFICKDAGEFQKLTIKA